MASMTVCRVSNTPVVFVQSHYHVNFALRDVVPGIEGKNLSPTLAINSGT
jgi:hypothetical protein